MRSALLFGSFVIPILAAPSLHAAQCASGYSSPRGSASYTVSGRVTHCGGGGGDFQVKAVVDVAAIVRVGQLEFEDRDIAVTVGNVRTGSDGRYTVRFDWCGDVSSRFPANTVGSVETVRIELRTPSEALLWSSPTRALADANSFTFDRAVSENEFECPRDPGAAPTVDIRAPDDGDLFVTDDCPFELCAATVPTEIFVDATSFLREVRYVIRDADTGDVALENTFCRVDPIEGTGCQASPPDFDLLIDSAQIRRAGTWEVLVTAEDEFGQEGTDSVTFTVEERVRTVPGVVRIDSVSTMRGSPPTTLRTGANPLASRATEVTIQGENLHDFLDVSLAPFSAQDLTTNWVLYPAEITELAADGTSLTFRMPEIPDLTRTDRFQEEPRFDSYLARWRVVIHDRFVRPGRVLFTHIPSPTEPAAPPFRVVRPPFPLIHGFGFQNEEDDPTLREFLAIYGNSAYICVGASIDGSCIGGRVPDPIYWGIWYPIYRRWVGDSDGSCVGLSATSLLFQRGDLDARDFDPNVLHPAGFTSPGKPARWDDGFSIFTGPPTPTNLWAHVRRNHGVQTSIEFIVEWIDDLAEFSEFSAGGDPTARYGEIERDPLRYVSCMLRSGGGHCVTPYGVSTENGPQILVYDNNEPRSTSPRIAIDFHQNRYDLVNDDRYDGTALTTIRLDVFREGRSMPGLSDLPNLFLAAFGDGDARLETADGTFERLGGEFVSDIPGLVSLPPLDGSQGILEGGLGLVVLPAGTGEAAVSMRSQGGDWIIHAAMGSRFAQVEARATEARALDLVDVLAADGALEGVRLSPESASEGLMPRVGYADGDAARALFRWTRLELTAGGDYEFTLDPANRAASLRNESNAVARHVLVLESVDAESGEAHVTAFGPFTVPTAAHQTAQILDWPRAGRILSSLDLDGDGVPESTEVVAGRPCGEPGSAPDADDDGLPDECDDEAPIGERFRRGDANRDTRADLSDAISVLGFLFQGEDEPGCRDAADANDDGALDISDSVFLLGHLFLGGPQPPAPGTAGCGVDPTVDALDCRIPTAGCEEP